MSSNLAFGIKNAVCYLLCCWEKGYSHHRYLLGVIRNYYKQCLHCLGNLSKFVLDILITKVLEESIVKDILLQLSSENFAIRPLRCLRNCYFLGQGLKFLKIVHWDQQIL